MNWFGHKGKGTTWETRRIRHDNIKMNLKLRLEEVEWIQLAHYCDKWEFLVNEILKFGFRKILGLSSLADEMLASQEGRCCV